MKSDSIYPLSGIHQLRENGRMNSEIMPASEEKASVPAVIPEPLTYSVEETALVLGISPPTVYRLVAGRCRGRLHQEPVR